MPVHAASSVYKNKWEAEYQQPTDNKNGKHGQENSEHVISLVEASILQILLKETAYYSSLGGIYDIVIEDIDSQLRGLKS